MSLKIKIPKSGTIQTEESPTLRRKSKRRQAVLYTDDEDDGDNTSSATSKPNKRARTEEAEEAVEVDIEAEEEVNVDDEEPAEDTRFLPPEPSTSKRSASKKTKGAPKRPKKRAVVLSDDDGEDDYGDPEEIVVDDDDEDFAPEPATSSRATFSKTKSKSVKAAAVDKPIAIRDERKGVSSRSGPSFPGRRGVLNDDGDDEDSTSKADNVEAAAPPPPKKPKLPPIKKNKPSTGTSTPTGIPVKPTPKADNLALGVGGARKPAATANNADFDLRDANVYASLFMKPGGSTPNSGLSRKEKEEERRKELNKMREDARKRREAEAQSIFDLQAAQEKISRFESRLRSRLGNTSATYPNVLGGAFKDIWERARMTQLQNKQPTAP